MMRRWTTPSDAARAAIFEKDSARDEEIKRDLARVRAGEMARQQAAEDYMERSGDDCGDY